MLKFIPFFFNTFFSDTRVRLLKPIEQQQWLYLLVNMMQSEAVLIENYRNIGQSLGISTAKAKALLAKLIESGLLVSEQKTDNVLMFFSRKLRREYEQAKAHCENASRAGKAAATKRWNAVEADQGGG